MSDEVSDAGIYTNCDWFAQTLAPFGAVLFPREGADGTLSLRVVDDSDGEDEWVAADASGYPVVRADVDEDVYSTWTYASPRDPVKVAGMWFDDHGEICHGLRAQALRCDLMLTQSSLRIGLSHGNFPVKGPWITSNDTGRLIELTSDCVFAAVFPYDEIEHVNAGRFFLELECIGAGLGMTGKIGRDRPGEKPDWVTMDQFTTELVDAAIDWTATSEDTARIAAAQRLEGTDYATSMSRRRGAKLSFT